jgi:hypothetical protein
MLAFSIFSSQRSTILKLVFATNLFSRLRYKYVGDMHKYIVDILPTWYVKYHHRTFFSCAIPDDILDPIIHTVFPESHQVISRLKK